MSNSVPEKIGKYRFCNLVSNGQGDAKKAVYSEVGDGKKVFVKISLDNKALLREYENQKLFYNLLKDKLEEDIVIPYPMGIEKIDKEFALIMEYISDSKNLANVEKNTKVNVYIKVLMFLNKSEALQNLPKITSFYQILSLPYFLIMNIRTYPARLMLICRCFIEIVKNSTAWLKIPHETLCQGDFNVANKLLSNNKIVFLDFSKACISHKYFNLAQAVNSSWYDAGFQELLWKKIVDDLDLDSKEAEVLKSFVLFNLMQRLCKRYDNPKQGNYYLNKIRDMLKDS